jgi:long-chain acyl-CoA synthetase
VDEVLAHAKERLAKFKVPRSVEIRNEPLPRTPAGKVRKPELRAPFWKEQEKKI